MPGPESRQPSIAPRPLPEEPRWPDEEGGERRRAHLFVSSEIGSCTRHDPRVGGASLCGDVAPIGVDVPIRVLGRSLRISVEGAFGAMSQVLSSDGLGVWTSGGGAYVALRPLLGTDITRRFFLRTGPQLRATWSFGTVAPGVMGLVDVGTRLGSFLEIGPRGFIGVDDVVSADGHHTRHSPAFAFGATLLARVFLR